MKIKNFVLYSVVVLVLTAMILLSALVFDRLCTGSAERLKVDMFSIPRAADKYEIFRYCRKLGLHDLKFADMRAE